MNKSFSSRIGNIEIIINETLELQPGEKMVRVLSKDGCVIKHDGDSSSILVSSADYEVMCEAQYELVADYLRWHIRESADEWNNRNRIS